MAETFAAALAAVLAKRELPGEPVSCLMTIARNKLTDSVRCGQVEQVARQRLALEPLSFDDEDLRRIDDVIPHDLTIATVPQRFARLGDLHEGIDAAAFSPSHCWSGQTGTSQITCAIPANPMRPPAPS